MFCSTVGDAHDFVSRYAHRPLRRLELLLRHAREAGGRVGIRVHPTAEVGANITPEITKVKLHWKVPEHPLDNSSKNTAEKWNYVGTCN